jgi:hypothetical protein
MQNTLFGLYHFLTYLDIALYFFLTIILLKNYGKLPDTLKVFSIFEPLVFVVGAVSLLMGKLSIPNTQIFHIFLFVQLIWITGYYLKLFGNNQIRYIIIVAAVTTTAYLVSQYLVHWNNMIAQLGGLLYFITNLLFVGYAIFFYLYSIVGKEKVRFPLINAAILIYFSGSSVIFLFGDYLAKMDLAPQMVVWILNVLLHIIFVLLIFVDIWKTLYPGKRIL